MTCQWFQANVFLHHQGAGSDYSAPAFICAVDALSAFYRARHIPGARYNRTNKGFPNVIPLDPEQVSELEAEIIGAGIPLSAVKKTWYLPQQTAKSYNLRLW
ncbi:MAG TPA: hypothetical protein VI934_02460 [Candidatus Nanoarchaeia archaeon]|nr:hypothetical protein [Candidatus Nanoarchaeia archaeon]